MFKNIVTIVTLALLTAAAAAQDYPPVPGQEATFIAPLATTAMLLDATYVDGRIVAAGDHGIVLISDDDGRTWRQPATGTRATLTGVHFQDELTGWVVGHDAIILRTEDGGETWEEVYFAPEDERPLFDVWFADAERGFAAGAYGLLLATTDGGMTWEEVEFKPDSWPGPGDEDDVTGEGDEAGEDGGEDALEDDFENFEYFDYHLNHIVPASDDDLYIAAEAGNFYRSTDGGETWYSMPTTYEGSFFNTLPLGDNRLLLIGLRGNMFASSDGGETFEEIDSPVTVLLNDGAVLADGTILVGGMAGALLESTDGGATFELRQQADRKAISIVLPVEDAIVIIGEAGVRRTTLEQLRRGSRS